MKCIHKPGIKKTGAALFWIIIWWALSLLINNPLFLPGPGQVFFELFHLFKEPTFFQRTLFTLGRILLGFSFAYLLAALLAGLSSKSRTFQSFLQPLIYAIQSVPVASFVILALFWMRSQVLSVFICFLIVFPVVYHNVLEGLMAMDPNLRQMGEVFELTSFEKFRAILLPQLAPYLIAAAKTTMGLAWKAGTAAEIIAMVKGSIGEALYDSKIYLEMAQLFALTLWIILLSVGSSRVLSFLLKKAFLGLERKKPRGRRALSPLDESGPLLSLKAVDKDYGKGPVIENFSHNFLPGEVTWIYGESGAGKTTLLNLMMGLTLPDKGRVSPAPGLRFSPLFQENRLIESWTVRENLLLVNPEAASDLSENLKALGLSGLEAQRVAELSGGMKRRVALARAVLSPGNLLLLDEPFRDLDQNSKQKTIDWINKKKGSFRGLVLVSHEAKEAEALGFSQRIEIKGLKASKSPEGFCS